VKLVTPLRLFSAALIVAGALAGAHALGWRDETRFLSGTPASLERGALYALLWFGAVLGAPVLALAAALLAVFERLAGAAPKEAPRA